MCWLNKSIFYAIHTNISHLEDYYQQLPQTHTDVYHEQPLCDHTFGKVVEEYLLKGAQWLYASIYWVSKNGTNILP